MAIRSASTGTSTTRRFTNQRDGHFSNTGNAGDWRCSGCGRFWSEAEPAGLGGEMPHLGHDEGILARPWELRDNPRGICSTSATRRCDDAKFKLLAPDDPNLEPLWETFEI